MRAIWKFRLIVFAIVVVAGGVSISNLAAELFRAGPLPFPSTPETAATQDQLSSARRAAAVAPFRSGLRADLALAMAGQAVKYDRQPQLNETAKNATKDALKIGPHDSKMWLVLALLQAHNNAGDPMIAESLKMSYLTGPGRAELIAPRLEITTTNDSLKDADLSELARSDVRAILTQYPDQRQLLSNLYVRASAVGKTFLEDSAKMTDPPFANSLRSAK
jgi:hypothetical protein